MHGAKPSLAVAGYESSTSAGDSHCTAQLAGSYVLAGLAAAKLGGQHALLAMPPRGYPASAGNRTCTQAQFL